MLPNYYHHACTYENTLIKNFFGLHGVKFCSGQKVIFFVRCALALVGGVESKFEHMVAASLQVSLTYLCSDTILF